MNIKQAKQEIKNAMKAYFTKDEFGEYVIPIEKQRPVFLMGPPGVGKTAIMEQIASELGVGLVSYSMTHHTRQSALGLPFIVKKNYNGKEYSVSEYTMSEIIASVYGMMEDTGMKEGILFLDEINCVSETLAPAMLEFLQYKVFGRHRVPDGWIVVTAGNPPEYNNSVREYDIVTWDRLKRIDVEPDYGVWKEYAYKKGIHPSITSYLDIKKQNFYKIETTIDGKTFVTARGWSDLSDMMKLYEKNNIPVNEDLIKQYLQNPKIAKDFAIYYDLFIKYRSDYQVDKIMEGKASDEIKQRAENAPFDERLSLLGLLIDAVSSRARNVYYTEQSQLEVMHQMMDAKQDLARNIDAAEVLEKRIGVIKKKLETAKRASSLSTDQQHAYHSAVASLSAIKEQLVKDKPSNSSEAFKLIKKEYSKGNKELKAEADQCGKALSNVFHFVEEVFKGGQEMLILVTELTANYYTADYISHFGCKEYFEHNKDLLFYDRQKEIISQLDQLELK
ncbi:ATP-binding protein [Galactobacillus timonensis]|uniref:ATP-binding protein n=1 Tax=Galactobacillus timonensis TaxID=2041840 RepID=UPI000C8580C9|nr:MoxR family ATPase [Galactobacillus timonensis]